MAAGLFTGLFDAGREGFLDGTIDWDTAVIKAVLVRNWTPDRAVSKWMSDMTGTIATNGTSAAFTSKTKTAGVAGAAAVTWTAVGSSVSDHYIVIYQASAVTGGADVATSAQRLIAHIDGTGANGLPVHPNGNDITVTWDTVNGIFKL